MLNFQELFLHLKTKSNSSLYEENLATSSCSICVIGFAFDVVFTIFEDFLILLVVLGFNSINESQLPQLGHFPNHFVDCSPQC